MIKLQYFCCCVKMKKNIHFSNLGDNMKQITALEFKKILKERNICPDELQELAVKSLIERGEKVAVAESCTGGLVCKRLTEVSGVSKVFECGVCSYANEIKHKVLGVKNETLDMVGAVSEEVARQMAQGVRKLARADYGVATTGIAGPTGGTEEKPVGLVYIAVNSKNGTAVYKSFLTEDENSDREFVRKNASDLALFTLLSELSTEKDE